MVAPLFDRQRVILAFVARARRRPTKLQLVKWLFLLGEETAVRQHVPYYDFLPYDYGPFSFTLYNELGRLREQKFLDEKLRIPTGQQPVVNAAVDRLGLEVLRAVDEILGQYGMMTPSHLRDTVYDRYEWYASRSKLRPANVSPAADLAVYTIGYQGESIDAFLNRCVKERIRRVVDVRRNAYSQKYAFTGGPLRRMCGHVGLDYEHIPALGIPSELRVDLSTPQKRRALFRRYRREMLPSQPEAQDRVCELLLDAPSALLCMERHPADCHRSTLATNLAGQTDLEVIHLQ